MNESVLTLTVFSVVLFCGFMAMVGLHLRLLLQTGFQFRRMNHENDLIRQRLDDWVSGTGRE